MAPELELLGLASRSASGSGAAVDVPSPYRSAEITVDVTQASGGSMLVVTIETSPDGIEWRRLGQLDAVGAEGVTARLFADVSASLRASWSVSGAGAFTVSVTARPTQIYATLRDFERLGLPSRAVSSVPLDQRLAALEAASRLIDDYLCAQVTLPLVAFATASLTRATCVVAAYDLMCVRGFNPEGADGNFRLRYKDVIAWLEKVAAGTLPVPGGVVDSGSSGDGAQPLVESEDLRDLLCRSRETSARSPR